MFHEADLVADHIVKQKKMIEEVEHQARIAVRKNVAQVKKTVQRRKLRGLDQDLDLVVEKIDQEQGHQESLIQDRGLAQDQDLSQGEEDQDLGTLGDALDLVVVLRQMVPDFMWQNWT